METQVDKKKLLEEIRNNGDIFDRFADSPAALFDYRPALDDAWTIRENLAHLLDSEMSLFLRIRQAVAGPGSDAMQSFSLDDWKDRFNHTGQSMADTIDIYKKVHALAYKVLADLENADWSGFYVNHYARGKQTLEDIARIISAHGNFHLELLERNEAHWRDQKSG